MRILVFICTLFYCSLGLSQVENGCITINFETLPNGQVPASGVEVTDQFKNSFGLSFFLEDGTNPVIAEIGGDFPEAFGSAWGNDAPAPGVDMGQFFLTDDGDLSGLIAPPIILRFDIPIDTFSGCIVDIDFSEQFIIQARDINDEVILADTITAGDPNTGDGELSCWGFNLPGCQGEIYSIRYQGIRTQSGAFGLGLDNFTFCYTGFLIEAELIDGACSNNGLGSIEITNAGIEEYEYSIDGFDFSPNGNFEDLDPGSYSVFIRDSDGCSTSVPVTILPPEITTITILESDTYCDEYNGSVNISIDSGINGTYSIDGLIYQDENEFLNLAPNTYTVNIIDDNECSYSETFTIEPSVAPSINDYFEEADVCGQANGSIEVIASGGNGNIQYSIDGVNFSDNSTLENLIEGAYTIFIRDEENCIDTLSVDISGTPMIVILDVTTTLPTCLEEDGQIEVIASGGVGELSYSVDGISYQSDSLILNLAFGTYEIIVEDELGCQSIQSAVIEVPLCSLYIPNAFSPEGNGFEDIFQAFANEEYEVGILDFRVYDRWGELVFVSGQFSIHTDDNQNWWDGYIDEKPANIGVYTYMLQVEHPNGTVELYTNDFTLVR